MKRIYLTKTKLNKVGVKMPIFKGSDCPKRIGVWLVISILLSMILIYYAGNVFGLIGATMSMLASLVAIWYILDYYGDFLFKDKKSIPTKTDIDSNKGRKFPYGIR